MRVLLQNRKLQLRSLIIVLIVTAAVN